MSRNSPHKRSRRERERARAMRRIHRQLDAQGVPPLPAPPAEPLTEAELFAQLWDERDVRLPSDTPHG